MQTTLDKFGRIVIPKEIRDNQGLVPGTVLDVEEDETGIRLVARQGGSCLVRRNGRLVFTGKLLREIRDPVKEMRDARIRRIASEQ